jgi:hypothetical protein
MANIKQRDNSMLTFESAAVAGSANIIEKLTVPSSCPRKLKATRLMNTRIFHSKECNTK